ncbi:MAG: hypothetical protein R3F20_10205 [Planctomycetota bacterium]
MPRRNVVRPVLIALAALVFLGLAAPGARAQYEYEWGRALMEDYYYEDLAENVFTKLSKSSDKARKNEGLLGLSSLKRRLARRADDVAKRAEFNDASLELLEQVSKNLDRSSTIYWDTQFDLADTLEEVVSEDIDLIKAGRVPADKLEEYRKRNRNRLDRAAVIYEQAATEYRDRDREEDLDGWALGQKATLMGIILNLRRAELVATDPKMVDSPGREAGLRDMQQNLEDFALENDGYLFGMHGYYYLGRVKEELNGIKQRVSNEDVIASYHAVPALSIVTPQNWVSDPEDPESRWEPLNAGVQWLNQRAYLSLLEFTNRRGLSEKTIAFGEEFRNNWKACGYEFNVLGDLALVELARAYQGNGQSAEALEIAAMVSAKGGYQGQEADKLMSVIIRTTEDTALFAPRMLAAGANGAYLAGRKNDEKYFESIELYRALLLNLDKVTDESERNEMGRTAGYRIGIMLDRLGRKLESAAALEATYKRFNNEKAIEDPKLNEKVSRYWLSVLREFRQATGDSEHAKALVSAAENFVIANPPKGSLGTGVIALQWRKAENLRRQKNYDAALTNYRELIANGGEYKERAMVRAAEVEADKLAKNKEATPEDWLGIAKTFEDYKKYAATTPETEPARLEARREALRDADMQIISALARAAAATKADSDKLPIYENIVAVSQGFDDRTTSKEARSFVRQQRVVALTKLDRLAEAEQSFDRLVADDPDYSSIPLAAQILGLALRDKADAMPGLTPDQREKRNVARLRAGSVLRTWILKKPQKKSGYYTLVYRLFYDAEDWDGAFEILKIAYDKFSGKPGQQKSVEFFRQRMARCMLGKAEKAYNDGNKEEASKLFADAGVIYREIMISTDAATGEVKVSAPTSILAEGALTIGGFVVGPDRRGQYNFFAPENVDFELAQEIWTKVERFMKKKQGKTAEEQIEYDDLALKARFYIFLMEFQIAKAKNDSARLQRVLKNLRFKDQKEGGQPGGPDWAPKYKWLILQLSRG